MENKNNQKGKTPKHQSEKQKTATDNQWTSTNLRYYPDTRPRKDGPGGD